MIKRSLSRVIIAWVVILLVAAFLGDVSVAASDVGRTAASFLQIGHGARAAGMGGAYTAISEGATAAYWNPAGLTDLEGSEVSLGHFSWFQDINVEQASFAFPLVDGSSVMAASITYVGYGTIEGYDVDGSFTGELSAYDWAGALSLGYSFTDELSGGVTGKFINQKLDEFSASAFAADFGLKYRFEKFSLAAAVVNLGSGLEFDMQREDLPSAFRLGVSGTPFHEGLVTSFEIEKRFHGDFLIRQGIEFGFSDRYFLRSGYDYLPSQDGRDLSTSISVGAGLNLDFAKFDYAFTLDDKSTSEDLHRFSVVFGFGE